MTTKTNPKKSGKLLTCIIALAMATPAFACHNHAAGQACSSTKISGTTNFTLSEAQRTIANIKTIIASAKQSDTDAPKTVENTCAWCNGNGLKECPECSGMGYYYRCPDHPGVTAFSPGQICDACGAPMQPHNPCDNGCTDDGTGFFYVGECTHCNGTGVDMTDNTDVMNAIYAMIDNVQVKFMLENPDILALELLFGLSYEYPSVLNQGKTPEELEDAAIAMIGKMENSQAMLDLAALLDDGESLIEAYHNGTLEDILTTMYAAIFKDISDEYSALLIEYFNPEVLDFVRAYTRINMIIGDIDLIAAGLTEEEIDLFIAELEALFDNFDEEALMGLLEAEKWAEATQVITDFVAKMDEILDKYKNGLISGISPAVTDYGIAKVSGYYTITGQRLSKEPERGLYIMLYNNGKTVKVMK